MFPEIPKFEECIDIQYSRSQKSQELLKKYQEDIDEIISFASQLEYMDDNEVRLLLEEKEFVILGNGVTANVIEFKINDDISLALKIYSQESPFGIDDFNSYEKAQARSGFDTVVPICASDRYLLMTQIPEGVISYSEFVKNYPEEREYVKKVLLDLMQQEQFGMDSCFIDDPIEVLNNPHALPSDTFISAYHPDKSGSERFRFFIIDFSIDDKLSLW